MDNSQAGMTGIYLVKLLFSCEGEKWKKAHPLKRSEELMVCPVFIEWTPGPLGILVAIRFVTPSPRFVCSSVTRRSGRIHILG